MAFIYSVIWFACSAAVWFIYHKLFSVIYFDLGDGCMREIIACGVVGLIVAAIIIRFWYISLILAILLLVALFKKKDGGEK